MNSEKQKPVKKKGPIRTEAVVPILIVIVLTWAYFHFFFDYHLKKAFEFIGYQVVGAQVDISNVETSFLNGTFRLQGLEITNSQKPDRNLIAIGDIRFGVLWDGLLRARLVVDEMAVEQIQIDTPRKSPGRVKPPEPKKEEESGALGKAANEMKARALEQTKKKYGDNVLGDLAAILGGASSDAQLSKLESNLASKAKLAEMQKFYDERSKNWQQKLDSLPKQKDLQALQDKISKTKTSNFKNAQELLDSINQLKSAIDEADKKYKDLQQAGQEMSADLKTLDQGIKDLDALVKKDVADLESRFRIPKLNAKSMAEGVFRSYLNPYLARMSEYKDMAEKYMPPNLMNKKKPDEADIQMQPRPRAKGVSYEFGKPKSYPMFWIRKISVSSKASPTLGTGDISGLITDVTSNQVLIGKPTVAALKGDFPSLGVQGFSFKGTFDNLKAVPKVSYDTSVASYNFEGRPLVESEDVTVLFTKADAGFRSSGEMMGFKDLKFSLGQSLRKIDFKVEAKNSTVDEILKSVFASLPVVTLDVQGGGHLPDLSLAIDSNLGPELQKGFEREVKKKVDEARLKIQNYVDEQVGSQKAKLEADYNRIKSQVDEQVKKLQSQLDSQKKVAENKIESAKKDEENKAKNQLQKEGEKALDDLKKKFGL
jgi:uncharacterized protein (TIGR03545 family)